MAFNFTGRLQLVGPANVGQIRDQINRQLSGIKIPIQIDTSVSTEIKKITGDLVGLNTQLAAIVRNGAAASAALGRLSSSFSPVSQNYSKLSSEAQKVNFSLVQTSAAAKTATDSITQFGDATALATKRALAFAVGAGAIFTVVNSIRSGVGAAIQFERQLVRLNQVGGNTSREIAGIADEIDRVSRAYGASSKDLSEVSVTLSQAGIRGSEVKKVLDALAQSTLAPTFTNIQNTVEGLISAFSQFRLEAGQSTRILDVINKVSAELAVESDDIVSAIRRAGGAFSALAPATQTPIENLQQFIALFSSVRAQTRESAEVISSGLRSIFVRLQRNTTVDELRNLGINLRYTRTEAEALGRTELTGQFVGPYEAVVRLNEGLQGLSTTTEQYARVAQALGGTFQISRTLALLSETGGSLRRRALDAARTSSGSLADSTEKGLDSIAQKARQVSETFASFFRTLVSDSAFQSLVKNLLSIAGAFAEILTAAKPLIPLLLTLGTIRLGQTLFNVGVGFVSRINRTEKRYNQGGYVPGVGNTDSVPAMLTPGEYVLRKDVVNKIGPQNIEKVVKGYARGGPIISALSTKSYIRLRRHNAVDEVSGLMKDKLNIPIDEIVDYIKFNNYDNIINNVKYLGLFSSSGFRPNYFSAIDIFPKNISKQTVSSARPINLRRILAHELGHALDFKLGGGRYLSSISTEIKKASIERYQEYEKYVKSFFGENYILNYDKYRFAEEGFADLFADSLYGYIPGADRSFPSSDVFGRDFTKLVKPYLKFNSGGIAKLPRGQRANLYDLYAQVASRIYPQPFEDVPINYIKDYSMKLARRTLPFSHKYIPYGSEFLGSGIAALSFLTPNDDVLRIQSNRALSLALKRISTLSPSVLGTNRPISSNVLQAISSLRIGSGVNSTLIERLPYAEVPKVSLLEELQILNDLRFKLANEGLDFADRHIGNVGRIGSQYKVIDPGAVRQFSKEKLNLANLSTKPLKFSSGGMTDDKIPALLTPGEYVLNRSTASKIGKNKLDDLNRGVIGFNKGGIVGFADGGEVPFNLNKDIITKIYEQISRRLNIDFSKIIPLENIRSYRSITGGSGRRPRGFYNFFSNEIGLSREKITSESDLLKTLSHEMGHALDKALGGNLGPQYSTSHGFGIRASELYNKLFGGRGYGNPRMEGFADLISALARNVKPKNPQQSQLLNFARTNILGNIPADLIRQFPNLQLPPRTIPSGFNTGILGNPNTEIQDIIGYGGFSTGLSGIKTIKKRQKLEEYFRRVRANTGYGGFSTIGNYYRGGYGGFSTGLGGIGGIRPPIGDITLPPNQGGAGGNPPSNVYSNPLGGRYQNETSLQTFFQRRFDRYYSFASGDQNFGLKLSQIQKELEAALTKRVNVEKKDLSITERRALVAANVLKFTEDAKNLRAATAGYLTSERDSEKYARQANIVSQAISKGKVKGPALDRALAFVEERNRRALFEATYAAQQRREAIELEKATTLSTTASGNITAFAGQEGLPITPKNRGIIGQLGTFGGRIRNRFSQIDKTQLLLGASFVAPFIGDALSSSNVTGVSGIGGAISGAVPAGFAGHFLGSVLGGATGGPIGVVLGGVIGAFTGFISAINEKEKGIAKVRITERLESIRDTFSVIGRDITRTGRPSRESIARLGSDVTDTLRGAVEVGRRSRAFFGGSRDRELLGVDSFGIGTRRHRYGSLGTEGDIPTILAAYRASLARTPAERDSGERAFIAEVGTSLSRIREPLSETLDSEIDRLVRETDAFSGPRRRTFLGIDESTIPEEMRRSIPRELYESLVREGPSSGRDRLREALGPAYEIATTVFGEREIEERGREARRREAVRRASVEESRIFTSFLQLSQGIASANEAFIRLSQTTANLDSALAGTAQQARVPELSSLNRVFDPNYLRDTRAVISGLGLEGSDIGRTLTDYATSSSILAPRLSEIIERRFRAGGGTGEGVASDIRGLLSGRVSSEVIERLEARARALTGGGADTSRTAEELLSSVIPRETPELGRLFVERQNAVIDSLNRFNSLILQSIDLRIKANDIDAQTARIRATFAAQNAGLGAESAINFLRPGEGSEATFRRNLGLLTSGTVVSGSANPTEIATAYRERLARLSLSINPTERSGLLLNASSLRRALERLTDVSGRTADSQERLNRITSSRESRLSFNERYLTASPDERFNLRRGLELAQETFRSRRDIGDLDEESRGLIISSLRSVGRTRLGFAGGLTGEEVSRTLIGRSRFGLTEIPGETAEADRLQEEILQAYRDSSIATRELAAITSGEAAASRERLTVALTSLEASITTLIDSLRTRPVIGGGFGSLLESLGSFRPPGFSSGGTVYANNGLFVPRGTDIIPAMLTPGEYVVNKKATERFKPLLERINGYGRGGPVYYTEGGIAEDREALDRRALIRLLINRTDLRELVRSSILPRDRSITELEREVLPDTLRFTDNPYRNLRNINAFIGDHSRVLRNLSFIGNMVNFGEFPIPIGVDREFFNINALEYVRDEIARLNVGLRFLERERDRNLDSINLLETTSRGISSLTRDSLSSGAVSNIVSRFGVATGEQFIQGQVSRNLLERQIVNRLSNPSENRFNIGFYNSSLQNNILAQRQENLLSGRGANPLNYRTGRPAGTIEEYRRRLLPGLNISGAFASARMRFESGGLVQGFSGGDTVPALLTPGEYVFNKSAVNRIGIPSLNKANYFANGGQVGTPSTLPSSGGEINSSLIASMNTFNNVAKQLSQSMSAFPSTINLQANHRVEVIHNGIEIFRGLEETFRNMVANETTKQLNKMFKERLPDAPNG